MKNTLKDVFYVSAIVNFITDIYKEDQSPCVTSSRSSASTHHTRPILTHQVKKALKRTAKKYFGIFQDTLSDASVYESYNEIVVGLENNLLKHGFSTMGYLKYCCQVSVLASHAFRLGLKPSSRLAEFYILKTIRKFRSKDQFGNDNWRYMDNIVVERLRDNGVLT